MKKLILAMATIAAISVAGPAQADLSIDNFRKMSKGTQTERFGVEMYVGGVVKGYLNASPYTEVMSPQPVAPGS